MEVQFGTKLCGAKSDDAAERFVLEQFEGHLPKLSFDREFSQVPFPKTFSMGKIDPTKGLQSPECPFLPPPHAADTVDFRDIH